MTDNRIRKHMIVKFLIHISILIAVVGIYFVSIHPKVLHPKPKEAPIINTGFDEVKISELAYIQALPNLHLQLTTHSYKAWIADSDNTHKFIEESLRLQRVYLGIVTELAQLHYEPGAFGGDPRAHFETNANQEMARFRALRKSPSPETEDIEIMLASLDGGNYLKEQIKEIVKHVSTTNKALNYQAWEVQWDKATK